MRFLLTLAVWLCLVGPAAAGMACTFATECLEGEDCAESGYAISVETGLVPGSLAAEGGLPTGDTIVSDAETVEITWAGSGPALAAFGATRSGFHLRSVAPDGAARYSVHLPAAELTILYIGTCEGT